MLRETSQFFFLSVLLHCRKPALGAAVEAAAAAVETATAMGAYKWEPLYQIRRAVSQKDVMSLHCYFSLLCFLLFGPKHEYNSGKCTA